MSEWQTPKTDWSASQEQGVSGADFNRIEGNIEWLYDYTEYLYNRWRTDHFIISGGNVNGWSVNASTTRFFQAITRSVPAGHRIQRLRTSYSTPLAEFIDFRIRISVGEDTFEEQLDGGDQDNFSITTMYENNTENDVNIKIQVGIRNTSGGTDLLNAPTVGWYLPFRVIPI